jgi:FMN reductase
VARPVLVVGLGGSLRAESTSRTALQVALDGAADSGADTELIWLRDLGLPLYSAEHARRQLRCASPTGCTTATR